MASRRSRDGETVPEVLTLFRKRAFEFSFLDNGKSSVVVVSRAIRLVPFYYYWILVRVHAVEMSRAAMTVSTFNTFPALEDTQEFSQVTKAASVQVDSDTRPPLLLSDDVSNNGPFLKVVVQAEQGGASGDRLYAELSASLYARPA